LNDLGQPVPYHHLTTIEPMPSRVAFQPVSTSKMPGLLSTSLDGDQNLLQAITLKASMPQRFIRVRHQTFPCLGHLNGNLLNNPPT
jgi:hypothetical protein